MRLIPLLCFSFLILCGTANAHPLSDSRWEVIDHDREALVDCAAAPEASGCRERLYPCESAFDLSIDADLAALPDDVRHDLTACFMAYADLYEVALWNIAPGSDPDPIVTRNANSLFNNMMFRHHRNASGECRSDREEKTEDWRC